MRQIIVILLLILIPISGFAADKWTKKQMVSQVVASTLIIIDWGQTLDISKNPDEYSELNPLLDEHPSQRQVNQYTAAALVAQLIISHFLPSKYRNWWLAGIIIIEAETVAHNYHIGLRVNFQAAFSSGYKSSTNETSPAVAFITNIALSGLIREPFKNRLITAVEILFFFAHGVGLILYFLKNSDNSILK